MDETPRERKSLLFIDDEAVNLLALQAVFRRDYQVYTASSASEGLRILDGTRVDAVVSDQRMPKMKGTELFAALSRESYRGARIILTGYQSDADIAAALEKGSVDAVLAKPLEYRRLVDLIERDDRAG